MHGGGGKKPDSGGGSGGHSGAKKFFLFVLVAGEAPLLHFGISRDWNFWRCERSSRSCWW